MTPIVTGTVILTDHALAVIQDVLRAAGIESIRCSDGPRTVEQQAEIMFLHCQKRGAAAQYKLYGPIGDQVVDVYVALKDKAQPGEIKLAMAVKIHQLGGFNVSHHCCGGPDSPVDVYDFAPSSVPAGKHKAFEAALSAEPRVMKWIGPPKDLAWHVEIVKGA
jgi:hypothetical protein